MTPLMNRSGPRIPSILSTGTTLALLLASVLALPVGAEAQRAVRRDGEPSGGSSGASSGGASRREPAPSGPSSSGGSSSPRGDGPTTATASSGSTDSGGSRRGSSDEPPTHSRPRGGQTSTGTAVARRGSPPYGDGIDNIYVPVGGYYPWGYGGFGFGAYYGSYYDPWYPFYDAYGGQPYYANLGEGALRLKVKPRDATVHADGYYVGRVDDFDGMFQRLHLEPGPHRIEVRADGYETLEFEVRLLPDKTVTYEGELKPLP